jgi:salicylate hydroxylase
MPLSVGIVGAGIAGLGAAIGLKRAGHSVELFETSRLQNEIGAAITITPNGVKVLDAWGFDHVKAGATTAKQLRMVDAETLETKIHTDFSDVPERFGHEFYQYHRVDLHSGLRALAEREGGGLVLRTGSKVAGVDAEKGIITLEGGKEVKKDLVVIANGARVGPTPCLCISCSVHLPTCSLLEQTETDSGWL